MRKHLLKRRDPPCPSRDLLLRYAKSLHLHQMSQSTDQNLRLMNHLKNIMMRGIHAGFLSQSLKTQSKLGIHPLELFNSRQYPFEVETDRLELEVDSINKWTEDQL